MAVTFSKIQFSKIYFYINEIVSIFFLAGGIIILFDCPWKKGLRMLITINRPTVFKLLTWTSYGEKRLTPLERAP